MDFLLLDHPAFDAHLAGEEHVERPERLRAIRHALRAAHPRLASSAAEPITERALETVHTHDHVRRIVTLGDAPVMLDADTPAGAGSREAAFHSAGAAWTLGAHVARGGLGFSLGRPPGHHAERDRAMGFCLFNNAALAARSAQANGARRVAVLDFDVHHGNGTQNLFEEDPSVFFASIHQWPEYPGTGAPDEIGRGAGLGHTMNVALPAGCGPGDYGAALRTLILPVFEAFAPDAIVVSAGYDAHLEDPLGAMELDDETYGWIAQELLGLARSRGIGLGFVLEGGYAPDALARSVTRTIDALLGAPCEARPNANAGREAIRATCHALAPYWPDVARHWPH